MFLLGQIGTILGDLVKKPRQLGCAIRNERIVLDIIRRKEFGHRLFNLLITDQFTAAELAKAAAH